MTAKKDSRLAGLIAAHKAVTELWRGIPINRAGEASGATFDAMQAVGVLVVAERQRRGRERGKRNG